MLIIDAHGKVPLNGEDSTTRGILVDQTESICASNWAISQSVTDSGKAQPDSQNLDLSLVPSREWTRDMWQLMSSALTGVSIPRKCLITLVSSVGEHLHECVQGRVIAAIAVARVPLLSRLIKADLQQLIFPNSLLVTPAMLQILIASLFSSLVAMRSP
jgi:hypothetical protein